MDTFLADVRQTVAQRLEELDGVLALRADHDGATPHLYRPGDDLSDLVLEPRYPLGLTLNMIMKANPEVRIGVVVRGCDERALVEMAKRNQVDMERIFLIGIACTAEEAAECRCELPFPTQVAIGEIVEGVADERLAQYEAMSISERRQFWEQQFAKCYKCYGCRNICPECFCEACALEDEVWVERGILAPPFPSYHLVRAMHMVGRCVSCRQCELVCPADIPLTILYRLLNRDAAELFGYQPGRSVDEKPPLVLSLEEQ
jgi:ferredoxin